MRGNFFAPLYFVQTDMYKASGNGMTYQVVNLHLVLLGVAFHGKLDDRVQTAFGKQRIGDRLRGNLDEKRLYVTPIDRTGG